jgi:hypothetical protein
MTNPIAATMGKIMNEKRSIKAYLLLTKLPAEMGEL